MGYPFPQCPRINSKHVGTETVDPAMFTCRQQRSQCLVVDQISMCSQCNIVSIYDHQINIGDHNIARVWWWHGDGLRTTQCLSSADPTTRCVLTMCCSHAHQNLSLAAGKVRRVSLIIMLGCNWHPSKNLHQHQMDRIYVETYTQNKWVWYDMCIPTSAP
jgi:hypothetical protein